VTRTRWKRVEPWLLALFATIALGFQLKGCVDDELEKRERRAFQSAAETLAIAAFPEWSHARIVSSKIGFAGSVCGWIDDGTQGALPFTAYPSIDSPSEPRVSVAKPDSGTSEERARQAFEKQLIIQICLPEGPSLPANAHSDPEVDPPLRALWLEEDGQIQDTQVRWAVIPARGDPGYYAVARGIAGGPILSPLLPSIDAAEAWVLSEGPAFGLSARLEGRRRVAEYNACMDRLPPGDPSRTRC
jgi:hypothetical protein